MSSFIAVIISGIAFFSLFLFLPFRTLLGTDRSMYENILGRHMGDGNIAIKQVNSTT